MDDWDYIWKVLVICCPMIDWIILLIFIQSSIIGCPMIGYDWWDIIIWIMINLYMVILWMNDSWYHIRKSNCWLSLRRIRQQPYPRVAKFFITKKEKKIFSLYYTINWILCVIEKLSKRKLFDVEYSVMQGDGSR